MVQTWKLPCNVKFMIEGEEEIGSPSLPKFCQEHKDMLKADVILVSDTSMIAADIPSITTGLRGLAYWQVEMTGPCRDLHSGLFGGAVANPINVLAKMIARMVDDKGHITIPGFYDDVLVVSAAERAKMAEAPFNPEAYKKHLVWMTYSAKRDIRPMKEREFVLHSMFAEFGEDIPAKVQKPYCLLKHSLK